jgi:hypothetical protein
MSNGNKEEKKNIFGFLILLSDYMGTAVQHTDGQSLLVEENHTIQVILQAHIAVVTVVSNSFFSSKNNIILNTYISLLSTLLYHRWWCIIVFCKKVISF